MSTKRIPQPDGAISEAEQAELRRQEGRDALAKAAAEIDVEKGLAVGVAQDILPTMRTP